MGLILIAEFAIAFAVGLKAKRALWRWLAGLALPVALALVLGLPGIDQGHAGAGFVYFVVLLTGGIVVAGFGSFFGYLVVRESNSR